MCFSAALRLWGGFTGPATNWGGKWGSCAFGDHPVSIPGCSETDSPPLPAFPPDTCPAQAGQRNLSLLFGCFGAYLWGPRLALYHKQCLLVQCGCSICICRSNPITAEPVGDRGLRELFRTQSRPEAQIGLGLGPSGPRSGAPFTVHVASRDGLAPLCAPPLQRWTRGLGSPSLLSVLQAWKHPSLPPSSLAQVHGRLQAHSSDSAASSLSCGPLPGSLLQSVAGWGARGLCC